jgi:hypothetical protein
MFQPPTTLDIRVNHQLVGQATDAVTANEINARLDVMANWMVGEDATKWSLLWRDWLEIARPEQLPPVDPNWREWKIGGDPGSGKSRAAAEFICSQFGTPNLRVYVIGKTQKTLSRSVAMLHSISDAPVIAKSSSFEICGVPIIHRTVDMIDDYLGLSNGCQTIVWIEDLIFLPPGVSIGKFHSFIKQMLRAPRTRVIWSG